MSTTKFELAKQDDIEAKTIESIVTKGDISALNAKDRAIYYVRVCEALGLNPLTNPLAILRLQGKEILYPHRGATDQLAKIHGVNREIIDGPKVIDLEGTKLVYAVCRATLPNGRTETEVATVPLTDPVNVLMKCSTKAKRRATLSIVGLGMLDETEIDTIPADVRQEIPQIDPRPALEAPGKTVWSPKLEDTGQSPIARAIEATAEQAKPAAKVAEKTRKWIASMGCERALHHETLERIAVLSALPESERDPIWRLYCDRLTALLRDTDDGSIGSLRPDLEALPRALLEQSYAEGLRAQIARAG